MSIKQLLEQLELYGAKVITQVGGSFTCKCRFSHTFTYEKLEDWCKICQTSDFQESLISEINSELTEQRKVFTVTQYGTVTIICSNDHITTCDLDDIPNNCRSCNTEISRLSVGYENSIYVTSSADDTSGDNMNDIDYFSNDDIEYITDTELQYETDNSVDECDSEPISPVYEDMYMGYNWFEKWNTISDDHSSLQNYRETQNDLFKQFGKYMISDEFKNFDIEYDKFDKSIYMKKESISNFRHNNIECNLVTLIERIEEYNELPLKITGETPES